MFFLVCVTLVLSFFISVSMSLFHIWLKATKTRHTLSLGWGHAVCTHYGCNRRGPKLAVRFVGADPGPKLVPECVIENRFQATCSCVLGVLCKQLMGISIVQCDCPVVGVKACRHAGEPNCGRPINEMVCSNNELTSCFEQVFGQRLHEFVWAWFE